MLHSPEEYSRATQRWSGRTVPALRMKIGRSGLMLKYLEEK